MKSLILKDLYNISHNAKTMLFLLLIFAFAFLPTSGVTSYIIICAMLCGMMTITTLSFDDHSGWTRYAMIMPVSRRELVAGKFVVQALFCAAGSLLGLVIGSVGGLILKQITFSPGEVGRLLLLALTAWGIALVLGSMSIPLVFKFGTEKARILLFVSFFVPSAACLGFCWLFSALRIALTDRLLWILLCCAPFAAAAWCYAMYRISCRIFAKKEL